MEGLDLGGRQLLREVIADQRAAGKTTLIVSHALGDVAQMCDRVAVLVEGRLARLASVAALLNGPANGHEQTLETALAPVYGQGGMA